jgi:predicted nucleic acid-binding Zn ribbon protein
MLKRRRRKNAFVLVSSSLDGALLGNMSALTFKGQQIQMKTDTKKRRREKNVHLFFMFFVFALIRC